MLEEKLAFYFTLWVQTYGTPYIELANFAVTVPGRKNFWFQQKWDSLSLSLSDIK
jgi:hypothetical protein